MMEIERRRQGVSVPAVLACAAVWVFGGAAVAGAQEAGDAEAAEEARPAREIPWDTSCSQLSRSDEPDCEMSQMVVVPQSRQVLLRVEVEVPGDGSGTRMVLQLPHGIYLPAGLTLQVDGEEWQRAELQTCDGNGCYAGVEVDDDALRRLEGGEGLTVVFQSLSREEIKVPVDLEGFTAAYARIR